MKSRANDCGAFDFNFQSSVVPVEIISNQLMVN